MLEKRIDKVQEKGGRKEEEIRGIKEGVSGSGGGKRGGVLGEIKGKRSRRIEIRQDLVEREKWSNHILIRGEKVEGCDMKVEVKESWGWRWKVWGR